MSRKISIPISFALRFFYSTPITIHVSNKVYSIQLIDNMAIIIASENTEAREVGKTVIFTHLIDDGIYSNNIQFLTPTIVTGLIDISHVSNIEDGFDTLVQNDEQDNDIDIYSSDYCGGCVNGTIFEFSYEIFFVSTICVWIDDLVYDDLTLLNGGERSGLASPELEESGRVKRSSLELNEMSTPDGFNITRSLENPLSGKNGDETITSEEPFHLECDIFYYYGQNPRCGIDKEEKEEILDEQKNKTIWPHHCGSCCPTIDAKYCECKVV